MGPTLSPRPGRHALRLLAHALGRAPPCWCGGPPMQLLARRWSGAPPPAHARMALLPSLHALPIN
eukprot:6846622-Alexandrium_andersonii.AAC.1